MFALKTAVLNAQQWVPCNAILTESTRPIAQASVPTHLVIQAPTPPKHHRSAHHGVSLLQAIVHQDEMLIEDEFGSGESAVAALPKKIDLSSAIRSHARKTPRWIAIPDAHRTAGWKQPLIVDPPRPLTCLHAVGISLAATAGGQWRSSGQYSGQAGKIGPSRPSRHKALP